MVRDPVKGTSVTPRLLPVYLEADQPTATFVSRLRQLQDLTEGLAEWLAPVQIGAAAQIAASAVVVPDMSGRAYRLLEEFSRLTMPILVVTSEFGTVSMWDWEIRDFLRRRGVDTVTPTSTGEFEDICRALGVKEKLAVSTMLAYQDDLGAGQQPDIFKRFFWWEDECVSQLRKSFGVNVERRSYRTLWARAAAIPESRILEAMNDVDRRVPIVGLTKTARIESVRMYLALRDELDESTGVIAAGINCLNESETSTTTPCLAWNLLFEERGLMWGCEADLTSMITKYITWESLRVPVMMTNLYPFLMGQAALKHEKIPYFPPVDGEPENYILAAHCGYFGIVPQSFATQWTLRPRVLEIVNEDSNAIDARFPEGDLTILKIRSTMDSFAVTPAVLTEYSQYKNSDCLNGAVLRVENGYRFVEGLPSHHAVLAVGDVTRRLDVLGQTLGLAMDKI
jgi:hypothetical protein